MVNKTKNSGSERVTGLITPLNLTFFSLILASALCLVHIVNALYKSQNYYYYNISVNFTLFFKFNLNFYLIWEESDFVEDSETTLKPIGNALPVVKL